MSELVLISAVVLVIAVVLVAVLAFVLSKKRNIEGKKEVDYQAFFVMGIAFFPMGLIFTILSYTSDFPSGVGIPFLAMGVIYIALGLSNRDK
jgi:H+/Cl- antiporter ClcA